MDIVLGFFDRSKPPVWRPQWNSGAIVNELPSLPENMGGVRDPAMTMQKFRPFINPPYTTFPDVIHCPHVSSKFKYLDRSKGLDKKVLCECEDPLPLARGILLHYHIDVMY